MGGAAREVPPRTAPGRMIGFVRMAHRVAKGAFGMPAYHPRTGMTRVIASLCGPVWRQHTAAGSQRTGGSTLYHHLLQLIPLCLVFVALPITGCGALPFDEVELRETTRFRDDLEPVDEAVTQFRGEDDSGVTVGDILLGTENGGYIRRVESVTRHDDGSVSVRTSQAALTDAVQRGHFQGSVDIFPQTAAAGGKFPAGAQVRAGGRLDLTGLKFPNQSGVHIEITSGYVSLTGTLDWDWKIGYLPPRVYEFETTLQGDVELDLDIRLEGRVADGFETSYPVYNHRIPFQVGYVGGFVHLIIIVGVKIEPAARGTLETGLSSSSSLLVGARYDGDWHPISTRSTETRPHELTWNIQGTVGARAYVQPKLEVEFYGVASPSFDFEPYLDFDGLVEMPSCHYEWDLRAGIAGHLNFRLGVLDWTLAEFSTELFNWDTPIADDMGTLCPGYSLATTAVGNGSIVLDPAGGVYPADTVVHITAIPGDGWHFEHWEGDVTGSTGTVILTMDGDRSVLAFFEPNPDSEYILSTESIGSGSVEPFGGTYVPGSHVQLTAVPNDGWQFDHWEGDASGTSPAFMVIMNGHRYVVAVFETTTERYLSVVTEGCGSVSPPSGPYEEGASVQLTADPCAGWHFERWEGDAAGMATVISVLMDADREVRAVFEERPPPEFLLNVTVDGEGMVQLEPPGGTYAMGTVVVATAVPAPGWEFDHWEGDLADGAESVNVVMDGPKTVRAVFTLPLVVTVSADDIVIGYGESTTLHAQAIGGVPPYSYSWFAPGWQRADQKNVLVQPAQTTNYTLTVTDSSVRGRTARETIRVFVIGGGGSVVGWGDNSAGQLDAPGDAGFIAIATGHFHSLALRTDGSIVTWGSNQDGQLNVPPGSNYMSIATGAFHCVALRGDGSIVAWGRNDVGQLNTPAGSNFVAIAAGGSHTLALRSDGSIVGWGSNEFGQSNVPSGSDFISVTAGETHSLAIRSDGSLLGWGDNRYGQTDVPAGNVYMAAAGGTFHSLALRSDGSVAAWGCGPDSRDFGQCDVPAGNNFTALAAGEAHSIAVKANGSIAAWGCQDMDFSQCDAPPGGEFEAVAAAGNHSLALSGP